MNAPHVRRVALCFAFIYLPAATIASAQSSSWSPERRTSATATASANTASSAPLHADAVRRSNWDEVTPSWQRKPNSVVTPRSTEFTARANRIETTAAHGGIRMTAAQSSTENRAVNAGGSSRGVPTRADHQFLADYNIRLADGEKVVGQPTITERGPVGGSQPKLSPGGVTPNSSAGEVIPVPDDLSGRSTLPAPGSAQGELFHDGETIVEGDGQLHGGETIYEDGVQLDPGMHFEHGQAGCASCIDGSCTSGVCQHDEWSDPPRCPECGLYGSHRLGCGRVARCLHNCLGFLFREASVFGGTQAFKGPLDLGINGNFGFNEGFNLGGALIPFPRCGLGYQVGARWTQSDLSGTVFNSSAREQVFVTAGVFHRAYRGRGLQWGAAYDWLTDNYYSKYTVSQIRAEISWLTGCGNEFGFAGVFGSNGDDVTFNILNINLVNAQVMPTDMYTMFYRHTTRYGGQGRIWAGATDQSLPVLGADFRVPLSNRCDMVGGFNYIMPDEGQNNNGGADESWNLSMNIVFYFGRMKEGIHNTPFRPLFNVADNGNVMLRR
ncbi:MAG: hypothetical protein QM775_16295 [Pirellulales bacterium]